MGKRKTKAAKPQSKKKQVLNATFQCLFCNHENSVACKMDRKAGTGELRCGICGQKFMSEINFLSKPVDVYADWVDACHALDVAARDAQTAEATARRRDSGSRPSAALKRKSSFVVDDEADADGEVDYDE
ncbi:Elf1-domain-containing protein [Aulographum hederae CBS 113979]|uniref:Transcription elongation factor 1 homolog n=1 Tax=Aulographum hederae CBS 113979 TaxID=1176131 RepID=A0A6G1GYT2_9PEZI|nr:Elf1-domain-containing protein [Aulographum hederae CBS 113979]